MLSNVLSGSNIPGVTVALWDFSSLMHNCSSEKEQQLFWNKTQHKKYKSGSTALWETCRRVQKRGQTYQCTLWEVQGSGTCWATGGCFSYADLCDLILSSFWTSALHSRWGWTLLDQKPGCSGFTWALSGCAGWCYISPLSGIYHS